MENIKIQPSFQLRKSKRTTQISKKEASETKS